MIKYSLKVSKETLLYTDGQEPPDAVRRLNVNPTNQLHGKKQPPWKRTASGSNTQPLGMGAYGEKSREEVNLLTT